MLILKSQHFNEEELINFALKFSDRSGTLPERLLHWDFGPVMEMSYDPKASNYLFSSERVPFHWDGAFHKEPRLLLFFCSASQGEGGETLFTNTEKLWNSLRPAEQKICSAIELVYRTKKLAHYGGEIRVPLVQRHPTSGRTILRAAERVDTALNPVELEIRGTEDPRGFYEWMVQKLYHSDFLYAHRWEAGDLLIVDNFTYLHGRRELAGNFSRKFKRIQIL